MPRGGHVPVPTTLMFRGCDRRRMSLTSMAFLRPGTRARKYVAEDTSLYGRGPETLLFISVIQVLAIGEADGMNFPNLVMSTETSEQVT
jgi:hypothetical protein